MRFGQLISSKHVLARGAAILLATSALAGCSSSSSRFGSLDEIFTGATPNQRAVINAPKDQPYPGQTVASAQPEPVMAAPASAPVQRSTLAPVVAPVASEPIRTVEAPRPATPRPVEVAMAPKPDRVSTPKPERLAVSDNSGVDAKGWSRAGGTQITVKNGETVYNLSKRFGVPSDAILRANNLASASDLAAGDKVVIPTYVYAGNTRVSAPDSNPDVADAKSSRGTKFDVAADKAPTPTKAPDKSDVAVLPQTPKVRGTEVASSETKTAPGTYVVTSGDSLSSISRKTGAKIDAIRQANKLGDKGLKIGQKLTIPGGKSTAVASAKSETIDKTTTGTTGPSQSVAKAKAVDAEKPVAAAYTPPAKPAGKAIAEAMDSDAEAPGATGIGKMRWPARGRVISSYGSGTDGIDIAVPEGTPVKAAENGVVIYAGDGLKEFGNTVLVRHENGLVTVYGHAGEIKVQRGATVKRGQEIATSGMTGKTDTPKLHFEVRKDSTPVDPAGYLE